MSAADRDKVLRDRFNNYRTDFYDGGGQRTLDRLNDKLQPFTVICHKL